MPMWKFAQGALYNNSLSLAGQATYWCQMLYDGTVILAGGTLLEDTALRFTLDKEGRMLDADCSADCLETALDQIDALRLKLIADGRWTPRASSTKGQIQCQ